MSIAGLRFGHVAFRVSDVERSARWYADTLGAKKIYHVEAQGERPELMFLEFADGQCIELFPGGKNLLASPPEPMRPDSLRSWPSVMYSSRISICCAITLPWYPPTHCPVTAR